MESSLPPLPKYVGSASDEQPDNSDVTETQKPDFQFPIPKPLIKLYPIKTIKSDSNHSINNSSLNDINEDILSHDPASGLVSLQSQHISSSLTSLSRRFGKLRSQDEILESKSSEPALQAEMTDQLHEIQNEHHQSPGNQKMAIIAGIPPSSRQSSIVNINISRRNSVIGNIAPMSRRSSVVGLPVNNSTSIVHQRRASLPISSLMPLSSPFNAEAKQHQADREVILSEYILTPENQAPMNANADYYNYVYTSQNIGAGSLSFINRIGSQELAQDSSMKKIKTIGRFLIGDQIGKGSFGKVKEGICTETLIRVAVKIINKKRAKKIPKGVQSIIREIKLLRKFKHENVICLIDVYCKVEDNNGSTGVFPWFENIEDEPITWIYEDGTKKDLKVNILKFYLIFQYCPWTLQGLLDESEGKKFSIDRSHYFFVQMMNGLDYLHAQSVIHRDIKPGNMLITQGKILNIADFGVAEQFDIYNNQKMKSSTFAGTHQFLSPEIASGAEEYDGEKVDVWAAGITLFNMLTGRYPFQPENDRNMLQLYEKISACQLVLPKDMNEEVKDLLSGMLAKDPKDRFSVVDVLAHPWTKTHYSFPKNSFAHHKSQSILRIVKESTMDEYLSQLFDEEIEEELQKRGYYDAAACRKSGTMQKKRSTSRGILSLLKRTHR